MANTRAERALDWFMSYVVPIVIIGMMVVVFIGGVLMAIQSCGVGFEHCRKACQPHPVDKIIGDNCVCDMTREVRQ